MARPPYGPGRRRRHQPAKPPETAPQLFFRAKTNEEPPEIKAFNAQLRDNPRGVLRVIQEYRQLQDSRIPHDDVPMAVAIINLTISRYWGGDPPGIQLDRTTQETYLASNRAKLAQVGRMETNSTEHKNARYDLRLGMLAALALRTAEAAESEAQQREGILYLAPDATYPPEQAA